MRIELSFLSGATAHPSREVVRRRKAEPLNGQAGCLSLTLFDLHPEDAKHLLISPTNVSNDYYQR
jgi:hypothetical protein